MNVSFPSPDAPGQTAFWLDVPDDWQASPGPGISLLVIAPKRDGYFTQNVVVTHTRISDVPTLGELAAASHETLQNDLLEFTAIGDDQFGTVHNNEVMVREYAFTEQASNLGLYQIQMQTRVAVLHGLVDLVTVTATCAGGELDGVEVLRNIVRSFQTNE